MPHSFVRHLRQRVKEKKKFFLCLCLSVCLSRSRCCCFFFFNALSSQATMALFVNFLCIFIFFFTLYLYHFTYTLRFNLIFFLSPFEMKSIDTSFYFLSHICEIHFTAQTIRSSRTDHHYTNNVHTYKL